MLFSHCTGAYRAIRNTPKKQPPVNRFRLGASQALDRPKERFDKPTAADIICIRTISPDIVAGGIA
jgi:hypothetical protein